MGKFCSIVGVLFCVVSRLQEQCSVCYTIAPQFIGDDFSRDAARFEKTLEETSGCFAISPFLQINIDDLAILIDSAPQLVLFASDLHEHFV